MGMYTELLFKAELRRDVPQSVIDTLLYLTGESDDESSLPKDHEFFDADRWRYVLRGSSYYFITGSTKFWFDKIANRWFLVANSSIKNYDSDIEKFLTWISPHIEDSYPGSFLGYKMYEEAEHPTLLFMGELGIEERSASTVAVDSGYRPEDSGEPADHCCTIRSDSPASAD